MDESLMQRRRVCDEALRGVKHCPEGRMPTTVGATVPLKKAPANSVPAAAVIREQALSGFTGRKGRVGGIVSRW